MTLPQMQPSEMLEWASAVTNAAKSISNQSGLLLGYIHQSDMANIEILPSSQNLIHIDGLELSIIVPNSGLVEVQMQIVAARTTGIRSIAVGVTLGYSGQPFRFVTHSHSAVPEAKQYNMILDLEPGSAVTIVGGCRMDGTGASGILYRSVGATCSMLARAL